LGLGTVIWGLRDTRRLFGRPSLPDAAAAWLGRFPRYKVKPAVFEIPTGHLTISGHPPRVTVSPTKQPSLEERIVALEQAQRQQSELIADVRGRIDKEAQVRASELESERRERAVVDNKIQGLLEEASAGGLHIEWVGVAWLFVGLIFGTASTEIAKEIVKRLGG
jgi:hypothetical protein